MSKGKIKMTGTPEDVFCEYDTLKNVNLDVPQITKIISNIYDRGYNIDKKVVTIEKGTDEILKLLKNKAGNVYI